PPSRWCSAWYTSRIAPKPPRGGPARRTAIPSPATAPHFGKEPDRAATGRARPGDRARAGEAGRPARGAGRRVDDLHRRRGERASRAGAADRLAHPDVDDAPRQAARKARADEQGLRAGRGPA